MSDMWRPYWGTVAERAGHAVHVLEAFHIKKMLGGNPLDHLMAESGYEMVRYADDFTILCQLAEQAQTALALVQRWTTDNGLTLHPEKTWIVNVDAESFEFLG
ncbi:MAG: hypothetical protein KDA80_04685 [Planctomycetaceae bacterium]|nr:hypothetical protein [Planctomycetaceae bacterium]